MSAHGYNAPSLIIVATCTYTYTYVVLLTLPIIVVFSSSKPMLLSILHTMTSPSFASVIVIALTSSSISVPLRRHVMVIGGVPLTVAQSIVTLYPSKTYTGVPIFTLLFPSLHDFCSNVPSSISGGLPINVIG